MTVKFYKTKEAEQMGKYQETAVDKRKKATDVLIKSVDGGKFTVKLQKDIELGSKRGVTQINPTTYQVTKRKLEQLQDRYKVEPDF